MFDCSRCQTPMHNIGHNVVSAVCWECCIEVYWGKPPAGRQKSDKPPGWKFMKMYVHTDGTVYHKGIEQPQLKGTVEPTTIQPKNKKKKLTQQEKLDLNIAIAKLKAKLKKTNAAKDRKVIEKEIKTLIKQL